MPNDTPELRPDDILRNIEQQMVLQTELLKKMADKTEGPRVLKVLSAIGPIVSGLLIAGVGWFFSYKYNQQQFRLSEIQAVKEFSLALEDSSKNRQMTSLAILLSLDDEELAFRTIGVLPFRRKNDLYSRLLISAVESKDIELIERIIYVMPVKFVDIKVDGYSPLDIATLHTDVETLRFLLENGFKENLDGAFYRAAGIGSQEIVKLLLSHGANQNNSSRSAFLAAVSRGHMEIMRLLLEKSKEAINDVDDNGLNALSIVLKTDFRSRDYNFDALVEYLIAAGAKPLESEDEMPLLFYAIEKTKLSTFQSLMEAGAKLENSSGTHAIVHAAERGRVDVVKFLLEQKKISPELQTVDGTSLLAIATEREGTMLLELLLSHGAQINSVSGPSRKTSLMLAAGSGNIEHVKILLKHHADKNILDAQGKTALVYAQEMVVVYGQEGDDPGSETIRKLWLQKYRDIVVELMN